MKTIDYLEIWHAYKDKKGLQDFLDRNPGLQLGKMQSKKKEFNKTLLLL
jgi:hypothetical protein